MQTKLSLDTLLDQEFEEHHRHAVVLTELSLDPLLDQELKGHHRAERVLNTEVMYVRYLDRLDREDV